MRHLPELDPTTGMLPPGRYAANLDELHSAFVTAPSFGTSETRKQLWGEWERHRTIVEAMTGRIARIWVGGSFASSELNPSDVDVTYLVHSDVYDRADSETLAALDDLTDRAWCIEHEMRVDAYLIRLPEEMEFWQRRPRSFTQVTNDSFRDVGLYDEIWQCVRPQPGTSDVAGQSRRGYVEVLL